MSAVIRDPTEVTAFRQAAGRFWLMLERPPTKADIGVEDTLAALALLYASAHALPDWDLSDDAADVPEAFDVSDDEWPQVFGLIHGVLGWWRRLIERPDLNCYQFGSYHRRARSALGPS